MAAAFEPYFVKVLWDYPAAAADEVSIYEVSGSTIYRVRPLLYAATGVLIVLYCLTWFSDRDPTDQTCLPTATTTYYYYYLS